MYSSTSTITLQCTRERFLSTRTRTRNHDYFHDYFNEYPVSNIKATHGIPRCHSCSVVVSLMF